MRIGVLFPQTEIGPDVGAVRAYGQRVEELGFRHVLAYEHVLGADPAVHHGWQGVYNVADAFHEPMVLYGFLAGITSLEFVTGILVLPQRQAPLVAKQAAEVDLLSGGRFRLGIGVGWNAVEYEGMGQDFTNRGRRVEEQVDLLRRLWTEPSLSYEGRYHRISGAGLNPLPVQRPIPIWFGVAESERAFRRAGRWVTAGSRRWTPGPSSTGRGPWSSRGPPRRAGTRAASAWRARWTGRAIPGGWRRRRGPGRTRAPPTCR